VEAFALGVHTLGISAERGDVRAVAAVAAAAARTDTGYSTPTDNGGDGKGGTPMKYVWAKEMSLRYLELLLQGAPLILGAALSAGVLAWLWQRPRRPAWLERAAAWRWLGPALLALALAAGLTLAVRGASVFDDAFISFRYARNLLDGHGLVFNHGERVEGYTNFLWTVLLAGLSGATGRELPLVALMAGLVSYAACVITLACLERRLLGAALPAATLLFALQRWTIDYATSGMETEFALLWVLLGLLTLVRQEGPRAAAVAGLAFIVAVFTRPDHGLFWAAGGLALALELRDRRAGGWRAWLPQPGAWKCLLAYGVSFLPYALYLAWKLHYYGRILPNTYHAKSVGSWYLSQGLLYLLSFLEGAHAWVLIPLALLGLWAPATGRPQRLLRGFSAIALLVFNLYVLKVGGDFMVGRFYLVTLPLWLLLAHRGVRWLLRRHHRQAVLAATLLAATVGGVEILKQGPGSWRLSHEASHYRVIQWFPQVVIKHANWRAGNSLHDHLRARGIEPVIATTGIGMVGYYSQLELIDRLGLTDRVVARGKLERRKMVGHEKKATQRYMDRRGVDIIRAHAYQPLRWSEATTIDLGSHHKKLWHFHRYDAALADEMEAKAPELHFTRFEDTLDRWITRSMGMSLEEVERDVAFFERFYFRTNDDHHRRARVDAALSFARMRAGIPADSQAVSPDEPDTL
jgi:hypothetical protein